MYILWQRNHKLKEIQYNKRKSKFTDAFSQNISTKDIESGEILRIELGGKGYSFKDNIIIINDNSFLAKFDSDDLSRFPARIKALASFLHSQHFRGSVHVFHEKGTCELQTLKSFDDRIEKSVLNSELSATEKNNIVQARIGQGKFRKALFEIQAFCPVTLTSIPSFLVASHIKPWRDSSDIERLDPHNGFLFAPHVDKLFDEGYISFLNSGKMICSNNQVISQLEEWGINSTASIPRMSVEKQKYLEHHRTETFIH